MDDVTGMFQRPERITGSFNTRSALSKADMPQSLVGDGRNEVDPEALAVQDENTKDEH